MSLISLSYSLLIYVVWGNMQTVKLLGDEASKKLAQSRVDADKAGKDAEAAEGSSAPHKPATGPTTTRIGTPRVTSISPTLGGNAGSFCCCHQYCLTVSTSKSPLKLCAYGINLVKSAL